MEKIKKRWPFWLLLGVTEAAAILDAYGVVWNISNGRWQGAILSELALVLSLVVIALTTAFDKWRAQKMKFIKKQMAAFELDAEWKKKMLESIERGTAVVNVMRQRVEPRGAGAGGNGHGGH